MLEKDVEQRLVQSVKNAKGICMKFVSVFCQVLFPKKSVKIPCFHLGKFPAFGGHTHASRRMSACSIR